MKPEPLKDKELYALDWELFHNKEDTRICNHTTKVYEEEDIRSAIEWLINKIALTEYPNMEIVGDIWKKIEQAFPDIFKEKP